MVCPDEITCAMYADGELSENETAQLREHLAMCPQCLQTVAALEEENRALTHAIQEIDLVVAEPAAQNTRTAAVQLGAFVLLASLAIRAGQDWIMGIPLPAALEWLNPLRLSGQLTFLFNFLFSGIGYLANVIGSGGSMAMSIVTAAMFATLNVFVLVGLVRLLKRSAHITSALVGLMLILVVFASPSHALDVRRGGQTVVVNADETINDTVVVFGDSVIVDGTINGDLIAFCRRITVNGAVQGDVITFAQNLEFSGTIGGSVLGFGQNVRTLGPVAGSLYAFGQVVEVRGIIERNLYAFGRNTETRTGSEVRGDAAMFGATATSDGSIGRDLYAFGEIVEVRGNVASDIYARAGERVTLVAPAQIGGNLTATVPQADRVQIADGVTIAGNTDIRMPEPEPNRYATVGFYVMQAIWLGAAFVTGMLLFWLFPQLRQVVAVDGTALLKAGAIGLLAACAIPVAAIIVAITLIGLPIGLITIVAWMLGLYLAKIVLALFLGRAVLGDQNRSIALALLAGLAIVLIATNIPYVGGVINLLLTLVGFGTLLLGAYRFRRPLSGSPMPL